MSLLEAENLVKHFDGPRHGLLARKTIVHAVDNVSFAIARGETLGLVGESGCGKSTVGQLVLNLLEPTQGKIRFDGEDVSALDNAGWRARRRDLQLIFQDSRNALDPRLPVAAQVAEGLEIHGLDRITERTAQMLEAVGLGGEMGGRYPHELSGGQVQRAVIARALVVEPQLVVCDEPVAALDVSIQAQVVNLLRDLQAERGLAYLFISHDLSLVRHIADRVAVMYAGRLAEIAPRAELFERPLHPYTRALIAAVPVARAKPGSRRARAEPLHGDSPSPLSPPAGCRLHPRCVHASERCRTEMPPLRTLNASPDHLVACHHAEELAP